MFRIRIRRTGLWVSPAPERQRGTGGGGKLGPTPTRPQPGRGPPGPKPPDPESLARRNQPTPNAGFWKTPVPMAQGAPALPASP